MFLLGGDLGRFDITINGVEDVHTLLDRGNGVLLFGSHLGSFDVLRVLATRITSSASCWTKARTRR